MLIVSSAQTALCRGVRILSGGGDADHRRRDRRAGGGARWPRVSLDFARAANARRWKALLSEAVPKEAYGRAFEVRAGDGHRRGDHRRCRCWCCSRLGLTHRTVILLSAIPAFLAVFAIVFLVRETPDRTPLAKPFLPFVPRLHPGV